MKNPGGLVKLMWVRECVKRHLSSKSEDVNPNQGNRGRDTLSIAVGVTRRMYQIPVRWE